MAKNAAEPKCSCILAFFTLKWNRRPNRKEHGGTNRPRRPELSSTLDTHAMIRGTRSTSPTNSTLARTTRPHQRIGSTQPSLLTDTDRAHSSAPAGPCSIQHTGTRLNTHTPWPQCNCRPRPSWQHMQHILAHDAHSTHTHAHVKISSNRAAAGTCSSGRRSHKTGAGSPGRGVPDASHARRGLLDSGMDGVLPSRGGW